VHAGRAEQGALERMVICCSISSAPRPGTCVTICEVTSAMSG
jgi:hypothetical protein